MIHLALRQFVQHGIMAFNPELYTRKVLKARPLLSTEFKLKNDIPKLEGLWKKHGLGILKVEKERDGLSITVYESDESYRLPYVGEKACIFTNSVLRAEIGHIFSISPSAFETNCTLNGNSYCKHNIYKENKEVKIKPLRAEDLEKFKVTSIKNLINYDTIRSKVGDYVSTNVFKHLINTLDPSLLVLEKVGKEFGLVIGPEIHDPYFENYLTNITNSIKILGLGDVRVKTYKHRIVDFVVLNNPLSKMSSCELLSGIFEGLLESFTNTEWNVVENSCASESRINSYCEFVSRNI